MACIFNLVKYYHHMCHTLNSEKPLVARIISPNYDSITLSLPQYLELSRLNEPI